MANIFEEIKKGIARHHTSYVMHVSEVTIVY